jgi:hypothetical protein
MNAGGTVDFDLPIGVRPVSSRDVVSYMAYPLLREMLAEIEAAIDREQMGPMMDDHHSNGMDIARDVVREAFARRGVR